MLRAYRIGESTTSTRLSWAWWPAEGPRRHRGVSPPTAARSLRIHSARPARHLTGKSRFLTVVHVLHLSGVITIVNGGAADTENLARLDQVECTPPGNTPWVVVGSVNVDISQEPIIPAGTTAQYPYTIDVPFPTTAAACRNVASATITNHTGNLGNPDVTLTRVSIIIPTTVTTVDETAAVSETEQCPTASGFTCALATPVPSFPITFSGPFPQSFSFVKNVTNSTATCGTSADLINTATLTPSNHTPASPITDSATVTITTPACGFVSGGYCTYTKGGYAGPGAPGQLFDSNYLSVFPGGLSIGEATPGLSAFWTADTTGRGNLKQYVGSLAGGPGPLTTGFTNPTLVSQTGGGNLAAQTATLTLNVGFNDAGVLGGTQNSTITAFGNLVFCNVPSGTTSSLLGKTVDQVLADANVALGNATLPSYVGSFGNLNDLVTSLNESFDNCGLSTFATTNLCFP